jgi:putative PIN family toxin of toxin-antitoxin system
VKLVIDTNIILVSLSEYSPHHWVFKSLLNSEFTLCVTNEILLEYEEIVTRYLGKRSASLLMELLDNLSNVEYINQYYKWRLIEADPDDNKFVDCAISGNAEYLATEDKHFQVLKEISFPKVEVINLEELKSLLGK